MGKPEGAEKKPEAAHKPEGEQQQKHDHKPKPEAPKKKGPDHSPDGCHAWSCKAKAKHFNFCVEHYDHFKFGLIKKTGEPVSDYEKKFEHYQRHVAKRGAQKVA